MTSILSTIKKSFSGMKCNLTESLNIAYDKDIYKQLVSSVVARSCQGK